MPLILLLHENKRHGLNLHLLSAAPNKKSSATIWKCTNHLVSVHSGREHNSKIFF